MPGWDSYRAVYGAEVRAAAREFLDHGWPVVEESADTLMLITGSALDVLEVPAAIGRGICAQLRAADIVVPVAATPTGSWWYPVTPGAALPAALREAEAWCCTRATRSRPRPRRCPTAGCTGACRPRRATSAWQPPT